MRLIIIFMRLYQDASQKNDLKGIPICKDGALTSFFKKSKVAKLKVTRGKNITRGGGEGCYYPACSASGHHVGCRGVGVLETGLA